RRGGLRVAAGSAPEILPGARRSGDSPRGGLTRAQANPEGGGYGPASFPSSQRRTVCDGFGGQAPSRANYALAMSDLETARAFFEAVAERIEARLFGVREALRLVLIGVITDSHVLIDDVPGVGKTTMVRMLAGLVGLDFQRVQFTPD